MNVEKNHLRVGIFAGSFDPVHAGHIAFALQSIEHANLDKVIFLPERQPRAKSGVEHFAHRVAMLKRAVRPHAKLTVWEAVETEFSVRYSLPRLSRALPGAQLVLLLGSDVASNLGDWPGAARLLREVELVIGLRQGFSETQMRQIIADWPAKPRGLTIFVSHAPAVSSGKIRGALQRGKSAAGLLTSVLRYSRKHWLYIALPRSGK